MVDPDRNKLVKMKSGRIDNGFKGQKCECFKKMNFGDKYCLGRLLGNSYKNTQSVDKRHLEMLLQRGGTVIHWMVTRMG